MSDRPEFVWICIIYYNRISLSIQKRGILHVHNDEQNEFNELQGNYIGQWPVLELKNRITMSRASSARPVKQSTKYKKIKKKGFQL